MTDDAPSQLMSETARRIRELRRQHGLSARELAERCIAGGASSLTRSTIAKIESGVRPFITLDELAALAAALSITLHDLTRSAADSADVQQDYRPATAGGPAEPASHRPSVATGAVTGARGLAEAIADEISQLHRGRGLQAGDLDSRLGPLLGEFAGTAEAGARRQALIAEIGQCAGQLPDDYRIPIEASLALSGETVDEPLFTRRASWLGERLGRDTRTVQRRIREAEWRLAELIAAELRRRRGRIPAAPDGWYLADLRVVLRLDGDSVVSEQDRRIVSTREDLTEVMAWLDLPSDTNQPGAELRAEIRYGGHLLRKEQPSGNRFNLMVQLPKPLQPGEEHRYGLSMRMPRRMLRLPHCLVTPECQCDRFDLTVRFDPARLPQWIRRVDGETVRMFENPWPAGELLIPDGAGEVHQEFRDLALHLGYGIQWGPLE
jgi:transcriptional regulator with XRE-family HTH domain